MQNVGSVSVGSVARKLYPPIVEACKYCQACSDASS